MGYVPQNLRMLDVGKINTLKKISDYISHDFSML